jgi:uncharacterized RDD family membrane protein YckC
MVNDSVREELELKIGRVSDRLDRTVAVAAAPAFRTEMPQETVLPKKELPTAPPAPAEPQVQRIARGETTEFGRKKTSPTLVGFQPKTSTVPDWRLQLQNSIRQRKTDVVPAAPVAANSNRRTVAKTAVTPKPQPVEVPEVTHENPRVAAALQRIESSRRRFQEVEAPALKVEAEQPRPAARNYPFNVVSRGGDFAPSPAAPHATVNTPPKPRLVTSAKAEKKKYDTNKLPQLLEPAIEVSITVPARGPEPIAEMESPIPATVQEPMSMDTKPEPKKLPMIDDLADDYGIPEDADDLAAIPSRFLAGLFDTIIGGFAAGIVLSPFLVSGGPWMTVAGAMTIMAVFGIVMFIYMTIAIGLRGRTIGMRLFGIEMVDAEENEYPTMHQAAVSSAVYLLSLPMLGLGFLPLLFNEERRAAHDLISGTVLVREI